MKENAEAFWIIKLRKKYTVKESFTLIFAKPIKSSPQDFLALDYRTAAAGPH